ncbi:MAG: hypothetical protein KAR20_18170, partial [Candidatus Heimdallarchaeota archaeon]|nr:hypothetical protein [Candidatus Heimdallarchaeota archaeon]
DKGSRNYILIEQGQSFDRVLKPRIQKVMYSSKWKDGKPLGETSSEYQHLFKSLVLEQVGDSYWNLAPRSPVSQIIRSSSQNESRVLEYNIDWDNLLHPLSLNHKLFDHPFEYSLIITENGVLQEQNIDLIETFNYLIGLSIRTYEILSHQNREYCVVHGNIESSEGIWQNVIIIWRDLDDLNLDLESEFLHTELHESGSINKPTIYMNGLSSYPEGILIEPVFFKAMFA